MHLYATGDAYNHLQPRHTSRKERQPGLRERHATQRERHSPETPRKCVPYSPRTAQSSTYCHTSGIVYNQPFKEQQESHETEIKTSLYKELSTIEDIRASMRATESKHISKAVPHIPDWMLNLDINLDVTSCDIIPPFENVHSDDDNTFKEAATMSFIYDSEDENEVDDIDTLELSLKTNNEKIETKQINLNTYNQPSSPSGPKNIVLTQTEHNVSRSVSPQFRISRSLGSARSRQTLTGSRTWDDTDHGPRRYQGDKTVMSMQQGGIRSTPMQPKSKKFINQMITYRHMKIHDKKLQKAKPAVDTKMPSTFKMALDRKRLVETRLSQSWESSRESNDYRSSRSSLSQSISQKTN